MKALTVFSFFIAVTLSACNKATNIINLPVPIDDCASKLSWHGLIPGKSTREDVVSTLGIPTEKGKLKFDKQRLSYYAYAVDNGEISKYAMDRIFFRPDGLVDWMEIVEGDRNGPFEAVYRTAHQIGNKVDTVYSNNNYRPTSEAKFGDVLGGPDQIYVWAKCGLALDALSSTYSPLLQMENTECRPSSNEGDRATPGKCNIVPQHPSPYQVGGEQGPDPNSVVLMKFYFQPTSYEGFTTYYMHKLPYGLWDKYLEKKK